MPINVTGVKLRVSVTAKVFGVIEWRPSGDDGPLLRSIGRQLRTFESFMSEPIVLFDDEDIDFDGFYRPTHPARWPFKSLLSRWRVRSIVQATTGNGSWEEVGALRQQLDGDRIQLSAKIRLRPGTTAFRVRVREGAFSAFNGETHDSAEYSTRVRTSPSILTFIAMGGSSSLGSGSSGPSGGSVESGSSSGSSGSSGSSSGSSGSSSSSSSSGSSSGSSASSSGSSSSSSGSSGSSSGSSGSSSSSSSGEGIDVHPENCSVDPTLIPELMTDENRQCNDLCAGCLNFIEHLGLRVLEEEDLASRLDTLRHKEHTSEDDFCEPRVNPLGVSHRIVLGKWENSEHEWERPAAIKTFESILDEFQQDGGGTLLIVAQSLGGAKLTATVKDYWRWGDSIDVALFVSWDATHLGGGINSVGPRPRRVVNFFQEAFRLDWWQRGAPIAEADVEHDLTDCLSHNAIARSAFVHQTTYEELRAAIAEIRTAARAA